MAIVEYSGTVTFRSLMNKHKDTLVHHVLDLLSDCDKLRTRAESAEREVKGMFAVEMVLKMMQSVVEDQPGELYQVHWEELKTRLSRVKSRKLRQAAGVDGKNEKRRGQ